MLKLHLSDQNVNNLLRRDLYERFDSTSVTNLHFNIGFMDLFDTVANGDV